MSVAIVGAGPAGSATAIHLARAGIDVTLVERACFPRRKVCGEYLNGGAVAALDALGLLDAVCRVAHPLAGFRLIGRDLSPIEMRFDRPALACERATLDALLLEAARGAGARLVRGQVEGLRWAAGRAAGLTYRDPSGEPRALDARIVVGADGVGSLVARKLGLALSAPAGRFAIGGHYAGWGALDGFVEMYVGREAYFAINPLGSTRANAMLVVPRAILGRWARDVDGGMRDQALGLTGGRRTLEGAQRLGARVGTGPLRHAVRSAAAPGALLVGDAAGFLDPFTGQGVALALRGARAAATAVRTALEARSREESAFAVYTRELTRDRRLRGAVGGLLVACLNRAPLARRLARRLPDAPAARAALLEAIGGIGSPWRALDPAVLGLLA